MKVFLKKIILFALPLLLLSFLIDKGLNQVKRSVVHAQEEYPVWNDLYAGKANAEILVYGSSRALVHIDPTMIGDSLGASAYNLGVDGHNFRLQHLRHRIIMEGAKPRLILHSLDMFTLEKKKDLYNADQFLPYLLGNTDMWNSISDYQGYTSPDHLLPVVRYYGKTEAILKAAKCMAFGPEQNAAPRIKGFKSEQRTWNDDLKLACKKMPGYRVKLDAESVAQFESYLEECAGKDIEVLLVYSPDYYEGHDFVSNRDTILNLYREIAARQQVRFLDYSKDSMCLNKRWFYNSSHLNKEGAARFTQKLIGDLKRTPVDLLNRAGSFNSKK